MAKYINVKIKRKEYCIEMNTQSKYLAIRVNGMEEH